MNIFAKLRRGLRTGSPEETKAVAAEFAVLFPIDATLALHGDLGTGKTVFVKGLASAWDIKETVASPTFNLFSIHEGTRQLVHVDAWRLDSAEGAADLMVEDFLRSPYCLAVEWAEKVGDWISPDAWHLDLAMVPDGGRRLRLRCGT